MFVHHFAHLVCGILYYLFFTVQHLGGSLALTAHNVHVAPSQPREDAGTVRESYRTRRKSNIEKSVYDSKQSFSIIKLEEKEKPGTTSSSSENEHEEMREAKVSPMMKRGPKSRMKLRTTQSVTSESSLSSSCNEDFQWKRSIQFFNRQKEEIKNEALMNSFGIGKSPGEDTKKDWDSLIKEISEGVDCQEFAIKEESESRQSSLERKRFRINKIKEDFEKFNDGEEDHFISFDLNI